MKTAQIFKKISLRFLCNFTLPQDRLRSVYIIVYNYIIFLYSCVQPNYIIIILCTIQSYNRKIVLCTIEYLFIFQSSLCVFLLFLFLLYIYFNIDLKITENQFKKYI